MKREIDFADLEKGGLMNIVEVKGSKIGIVRDGNKVEIWDVI